MNRAMARAERKRLNGRIDLICGALDRADHRRLLVKVRREGVSASAIEAMRRAVERIDGGLNITTDALGAAFAAGLRSLYGPVGRRKATKP